MLRNIPKILPPDLVKYMMEMGHSDYLVIADAGFPAAAHAKRLVRMDSVEIPELLEAILPFFPLDYFVEDPVRLMQKLPHEPEVTIWETYRTLLNKYDKDDAFREFHYLERLPFYEETNKAYVVVQTGDTSRYGNIILQKGVCV
ncbi:RbsD/FucU family protein [Enterocloster clostridioformis]|uniref:RbsD/FucU family protein n=1 Tax=Enterocloster clostridioformis TaxID=1531 RepID=UPI002676685C|nr:RbsD/FucU family protein [Enterocloster clostridioformis]